MFDKIDLTSIQDENARQRILRLLNLIEKVSADLREAQIENQRLRDAVNRLKGEQGKPDIKGNTPKATSQDHSSETERCKPRERQTSSKQAKIEINREQVVEVDPAILPPDAKFKGYVDVVVQDIVVWTDNVLFHKAKYYAASTQKSYHAELPRGYKGQFGPGIQALTLAQYYGMQPSEPKILEFCENVGIQISEGELSNWLIKDQESFHAEKDGVYAAGLRPQ